MDITDLAQTIRQRIIDWPVGNGHVWFRGNPVESTYKLVNRPLADEGERQFAFETG